MERSTLLTAVAIGLWSMLSVPSASAMGLLIPNQEGAGPLAIESHRVSIEVRDNLAVTHVDQVFRNSSPQQLEATFIFPLPPDSTVHDFVLYINGNPVPGEILESTQARQVYENIVRRVRDPGLVEYVDGRIFQASIFPVPANGTQRVELEFAQVLELEGDLHRLVYPLRTGRTAATTLTDFTLSAEIHSSLPIRALYSPSHEIDVVRESENHAVVGLEQAHADLERDFVLYLSSSDEDVGVTVFTFDEDGGGDEDGYFVMLVTPRLEREDEVSAKDVTFVVDTSGSMAGEKLEQAQATLRYCVSQLRPQDRFNVVRFSTTTRALFDDLTPATPDNITQTMAFIERMRAAGGTAIESALDLAVGQTTSEDRPHFIIFITDGLPTVGETNAETILAGVEGANQSNTRIFTFGVGYDVDTSLLDRVAQLNGGLSDYVRPSEDIEVAVSNLYDRIAHPILTGVRIDFGRAEVEDVYPTEVPDLFAGHQVVLAGRFSNAIESQVTLQGTAAGASRAYRFSENFDRGAGGDDRNDFIPQLWATRKIGFLVDQIRLNGERPELRDEVMHLGLRYGLVTPYTSYLAVDDSEFDVPMRFRGDMPSEDAAGAEPISGWGGGRDRRVESRTSTPAAPMATDGSFNFEMPSGEHAVEASEEAERMQVTQIADRRTPIQQVGHRRLALQSGVWRELSDDASAERIQIEYLSDAYFRLLALGDEVSRALALGDHVELRLGDVIIEVGPAGVSTLDDDTARRIGL